MTEVLHSPTHFPSSPRSVSSSPSSSSSSSSVDGDMDRDIPVIECEREAQKAQFKQRREDQLSLLALLVTLFRKSLIVCKSDRRQLCAMEIGWPTNVRHIAHVTFDRFNGFLGLPVEFEPEVPRRAPSASATVFGVSTESMQLSYDSRGNSVPTILLLMQHCLYAQGGLQAEGIFRINAENSQEEYVRDQLNRGVVPDGVDVHCLAGLIKAWFRELPAGVLDSLSPEQVMQCETEDECADLIRLLPPNESSLLNWAINLMADVVQQEYFNKMNARNIAMVFAPNMTQMDDPLTALMYAVQVMNFLRMLIMRTLKDREDSILDSSVTHLEPSDENGHQSPSQPGLGNTVAIFHVVESAVPEFSTEPPVLETYSDCSEGSKFSDGDVFSISCSEKLFPSGDGAFEAVAAEDVNVKNKNDRSDVLNLKKGTKKLDNQNSLFQFMAAPMEKKGLNNLSCISSWTERIEAWR